MQVLLLFVSFGMRPFARHAQAHEGELVLDRATLSAWSHHNSDDMNFCQLRIVYDLIVLRCPISSVVWNEMGHSLRTVL